MHMSSWPCEFDCILLKCRYLSMTVLVINAIAECTCLWTRGFVVTHFISGVMAARVVVLWDKSVSPYISLVIDSSPAISSRWVIAIVSAAWLLGVGGYRNIFEGYSDPISTHS